jgi:glycerol dehydrogenase-like iron-containing ADH family enzyme
MNAQLLRLHVSPAVVLRGRGIFGEGMAEIARRGKRLLVIGGDRSLSLAALQPLLQSPQLTIEICRYAPDCCEESIDRLLAAGIACQAEAIVGIGGGKCLDAAKLIGCRLQLPTIAIPTTAATCAAWTALANIYSPTGGFLYDVSLDRAPELLILDYELIVDAPVRTLVAGIGDAIAKWYEASASSGTATATLPIAAVQQARILRDILFQRAAEAIANPGGEAWQDVVDANVLLAGVIGGIGGAQCRTVAAHAIHNGLTHLPACHDFLHGEKVAYGILVQLRLQETNGGDKLAATARSQLIQFYRQIGLPVTLADLGLGNIGLMDLRRAAELACGERSDIHRLPFAVDPDSVMAAMVSTTATATGCFLGSRNSSEDDRILL